jgi:hypothetical protein
MVRRIQTGKTSKETADAFDAAMQQAPKVDGLVYRGVKPGSGLAELADRMRPGTRLRLDEPVSTSIDPGQASSFGTVMFEIDSPAASYISGIGSKYAYEQEAVLAPGEFRVVSVEYVKMHFPGHGVFTVKVIKIVDETVGERRWRHTSRAALRRSALMTAGGSGSWPVTAPGSSTSWPPWAAAPRRRLSLRRCMSRSGHRLGPACST